jgi:mannosyltransferase OCH1-like enzyme
MIPKLLHIIWVGDETRRPDNCIETWRRHNPDWELRVWGNDALASYGWVNSSHMRQMAQREMNGVADLMRWEILYHEGGFVVDADSVAMRPLAHWLFECESFACWENEIVRPGLIAAGYVASVPENPLIGQIVLDLQAQASVVNDMAWKTVGPQRLTDTYFRHQGRGMTVWPSHFFIPEHFSGLRYEGSGHVFARQEWASTRRSYDALHRKSFAEALA